MEDLARCGRRLSSVPWRKLEAWNKKLMQMKTLQMIGLTAVVGFLASPVWAADEVTDKPLTVQQRSEIIAKYDTDKNGVLSQLEMKQLSPSDKHALARAGGVGTAKKAAKVEGEPKVKVEVKSTDHKLDHPVVKGELKG